MSCGVLLQVDLMTTKRIMDSPAGQEVIERGIPMVGESGIFTPEHVQFVQDTGCKAILVGESIVKQGNTAQAVKDLLSLR
jgi:indole-3-glycerol phosphate synthase